MRFGLLTMPALAHLAHARAACERRDFTAMESELAIFEQYLPASADMVLEIVPALDEIGEHARANDLFNGVYDKLKGDLRYVSQKRDVFESDRLDVRLLRPAVG